MTNKYPKRKKPPEPNLVGFMALVTLTNRAVIRPSPVRLASTQGKWLDGDGIYNVDFKRPRQFITGTNFINPIDVSIIVLPDIPTVKGCSVSIYIDPLTHNVQWQDSDETIWEYKDVDFNVLTGVFSITASWCIIA